MSEPLTAEELLEMGRFASGFYEAEPDLLRKLLTAALAELDRLRVANGDLANEYVRLRNILDQRDPGNDLYDQPSEPFTVEEDDDSAEPQRDPKPDPPCPDCPMEPETYGTDWQHTADCPRVNTCAQCGPPWPPPPFHRWPDEYDITDEAAHLATHSRPDPTA